VPAGETPFSHLADLCYAGLRRKYDPVTPAAMSQLSRELALIEKNQLAGYFLVVHDICRYAREIGVICQGRGSAAGSIVAYSLDITAVDPIAGELLFDRFLAEDSNATPDIDVDFAADRREEVIQYVYGRYGAEYTAMVANVVTFQARSAVADVGKALGFPADLLGRVREALYTRSANDIAPDLGEVTDFAHKMTHLPWQMLIEFCSQIAHFPRHLSIHNGGMIVTGQPLAGLVPLERATMPGRVVVQWDKDDVEDVGLIKIDLLSLGTLGLVGECFQLVEQRAGRTLDMDSVPEGDPAVWQMLHAADAIGCFQVESRAQMSLLPRLRPSHMSDLVIEVSLIRPGPIEGGMAQTYLTRRDGDEPVSYWHPSLEPVLKETLGVLIYQEQVLRVAMVAAGFTGAQADGLRRSMSRKRGLEELEKWRAAFIAGALARDVPEADAHTIFDHLRGFASYGFCKSHAASFAKIAYITSWLKCHFPLEFYCSILNAQPMGFYSVEVLLEDAKRHGIRLLPLHINRSGAKWAIEDEALRVPFVRLRGLGEPLAEAITAAAPFTSLWQFVRRVRPPRHIAERLVRAGAFDDLPATDGAARRPDADRRDLLWALGEMRWDIGPLDLPPIVLEAPLPRTSRVEEVAADYSLLGLAQGDHLLALYRPQLTELGVVTGAEFDTMAHGAAAKVAGRIEIVQRPGPAHGIAFVSLEDETGLINLLCYPKIYDQFRWALRASPVVIGEGKVQRQKGTLHLIVDRLVPVDIRSGAAGIDPDAVPGPAKEYQ
jgi:error-prone DNA polymerase